MIHSVSASGTSYSLRDFVEKFTLPQLVKVLEGYYDELQRTTIGAGTIYKLLTIESVETVLCEDAEGEESRIPLGYACAVERVAEEKFQQKLSFQDLISDSAAAKFVRVIETDPNFETVIKNGDKLKIEKRKSRENFVAFKKVSDKGKPLLKVPASCQAKFQALWDGEELPLAKFVKKNKLPVFVSFIDANTNEDTSEKEEVRGPSKRDSNPVLPEGVVKLKGILAESFVTAITEGVTSKFSFPKTLPISVVPVTMKAIPKSSDVPLQFTSNQTNEASNDIKEFLDDEIQYEDMSGFKTLPGSPLPKKGVTFKGNSEISGKYMTIAQFGQGGLGARHNTYTPAPSKAVHRSKSVTLPGKGTVLLQRTVSEVQLQTNFMDSEEHVYDFLNFSAPPEEVEHNPSLMGRRKSDPSTHQVSKQNLNKLLHVKDQSSDDPESCQHKVEMVSLQISKTSPTLKLCTKMKTFGRKENVAETESAPDDAHDFFFQSCASESLNTNLLPQTTTSLAKKLLFYGSEETESETTVALNQNILLEPKVTRSSGDALPPLPSIHGSCSGGFQLSSGDLPVGTKAESNGRRSVISTKALPTGTNKKESLPEPPQRSDKDTNSKIQQQGAVKSDTSTCRTGKDPPPRPPRIKQTGEVLSPEVPEKATNVPGDKVASLKGRQPVPSPRVKPRSFSKTSPTNEQKLQVASGIAHDTASKPETGLGSSTSERLQSTVKDVSKTSFIIPEDLSTLRVSEVLECLKSLNMQQFEKIFNERQVDGIMLVCLDEEALESFGMDRFHRLKLLKVIAGWRPQL